MPRNSNVALYDNAILLADAWLEFASREKIEAYEQTSNFLETFAKHSDQTPEVALRASLRAQQSRTDLYLNMHNSVVERLTIGALVALGIRQQPTKGYYPVIIDPDDFEHGKIDWR